MVYKSIAYGHHSALTEHLIQYTRPLLAQTEICLLPSRWTRELLIGVHMMIMWIQQYYSQ